MIEIIKSFIAPGLLESKQSGEVSGRYYTRHGACNTCGRCCTNIYLIHDEKTIESREEFEALQVDNPEYAFFSPVDDTEHGVRFRCGHLSAENRCNIYQDRPTFCKKYPSEKGILLGGELAKECGYWFEPRHSFDDVLKRSAQGKQWQNAGTLLP